MQRGQELKGKQKDVKWIERRGVSVSECHHKIPSCSCCLGMPAMMDWTLNSELKPFLPQAAMIRVFYHTAVKENTGEWYWEQPRLLKRQLDSISPCMWPTFTFWVTWLSFHPEIYLLQSKTEKRQRIVCKKKKRSSKCGRKCSSIQPCRAAWEVPDLPTASSRHVL